MKKISSFIFALLLVAFSCFSLVGCTDPKEIYDDEEYLAGNSDSYQSTLSYSNETNDEYTFNAKVFTGSRTIEQSLYLSAGDTIDIDCTVKAGKFKVLLIKDGQIYQLCEGTFDETISFDKDEGKYRLRVVGYEAEIDCKISFSFKN